MGDSLELESVAGHLSHISCTPEQLRAWHSAYLADPGPMLGPTSDLVQAVAADILDHACIESQVRQLILDADVTRGFCARCRHQLAHFPDTRTKTWGLGVGRQLDTLEMEAAARSGCRFCGFLLARLAREEAGEAGQNQLDLVRKIEARLRTVDDGSKATLAVQNWGAGVGGTVSAQLLWINLPGKAANHCNSPGASFAQFESHLLTPTNKLWLEDASPLEMARRWLRQCTQSHAACQSGRRYRLPSRLVSVANGAVKLVSTAGWASSGSDGAPPYATLSYCWGRLPFPVLTSSLLAAFSASLPPLDFLPKTFQDAILVTRELGLDYLWVDALCIVQQQEDSADWLAEAGHMAAVYGGAAVNLAAAWAGDVRGGLFPDQTRPNHHRSGGGGFCARVTAGASHSRTQTFHPREVEEVTILSTPLAKRAWALQERLLAPRTLYFGPDHGDLFWQCRATIRSSSLPDGYPGKLATRLVCPETEPFVWPDVLASYSAARLTFSSDRLPALSGIASRQHDALGRADTYLAGMWRGGLETQLVWRCLPGTRSARPGEWRAPSWSWLAVDGDALLWGAGLWEREEERVEREREMNRGDENKEQGDEDKKGRGDEEQARVMRYVQVLDAWTKPAGEDPFGAVSGGLLTLGCAMLVEGRVVEMEYGSTTSKWRTNEGVIVTGREKERPFPVILDCTEDPAFRREDEAVYLLPVIGGHTGNGFCMQAAPEVDENRKKSSYADNNQDDNGEDKYDDDWLENADFTKHMLTEGLVLQRCGDAQKGRFRRLGYFAVQNYDMSDEDPSDSMTDNDYFTRFRQAMEELGTVELEAQCLSVAEEDDNGGCRYVITVE